MSLDPSNPALTSAMFRMVLIVSMPVLWRSWIDIGNLISYSTQLSNLSAKKILISPTFKIL